MQASLVAVFGLVITLLLNSAAQPAVAAEPVLEKINVFESGTDGYAAYRIPGIVVTQRGTVLAYCEARRGRGDWDAIDIMLRRSTDGGRTWSETRKIADVPGPKVKNTVAPAKRRAGEQEVTYNNPVAIVDRSGAVHFLFCLEYARCFYLRSDDDGATWSAPVEITATFDRFRPAYDWKVLATGPAHGIQLRNGRLLVPIWLSTSTGANAHHPSVTSVIFSDDSGRTWLPGEIAAPDTPDCVVPNETVAVQLDNGHVLLNVRNESKQNRRVIVESADGATGWSRPRFDDALWEPICMASMARVSSAAGGQNRSRIVFANPHNLDVAKGPAKRGEKRDRKNLSIKLSYDEGGTWPVNRSLEPGASSYSDLTVLPDGTILCLYERGRGTSGGDPTKDFAGITVARFNLEWLTDGKDSLRRNE